MIPGVSYHQMPDVVSPFRSPGLSCSVPPRQQPIDCGPYHLSVYFVVDECPAALIRGTLQWNSKTKMCKLFLAAN